MSAPRVLQARYADWRPVKGRKVLQLILEVPLEQQEEALTMLGAPLPDRDTWVAVARLETQKTEEKPKGRLAQRAGIMCGESGFLRFIGAQNSDEAAIKLRDRCGVKSRRELDVNEGAGRAFVGLSAEYENWLRGLS